MNWINKNQQHGYTQAVITRTNCGAVTIFVFLFFLFLFLFLPATAHAQGGLGANDNFSVSNDTEARYATLGEAFENVEDNGTITMLQNVTLSNTSTKVSITTCTLDFGGNTLDGDGKSLGIYAGKVTLRNGATTNLNIFVSYSELIVESGSYTGEDNAIMSSSGGEVRLIAGDFSCTNDVSGDGCLVTGDDGQIVIADGSAANPANWAAVNATSVMVTRTSTGIDNIADAKAIVSESYYDLTGKPASATAKGFVIKRTVYSDGSVIITKNYEL